MPDTTPRFDLPFQLSSDSPDGAALGADLAAAVEAVLDRAGGQFAVSAVAASQAVPTGGYDILGTPDRLDDLVLEENGVILCHFIGWWNRSNDTTTAKAALFLNDTQVKIAQRNVAAPAVLESPDRTFGDGVTTNFVPVFTELNAIKNGDGWLPSSSQNAYTGDVTTGQVVGVEPYLSRAFMPGWMMLKAAAGTYDLSVRFNRTGGAGTVNVKDRLLLATVLNPNP